MNLEKLNLVELNAQEVKETEGGFWTATIIITAVAAIGTSMSWAFDKGEQLGKAIAKK
jgi:lactobin A/cerein 7B family class IIb bacteriocin